jgi:hypothetical protein
MNEGAARSARVYFAAMAIYWAGFGLVTAFFPRLMDLFQSSEGVAAKTPFSDHVWFHGGLDILSVAVLVFALSRIPANPVLLRAAAVVALLPTAAITTSLVATPFWNPLFASAGLGCLAFAIWGFALSRRTARP